MKLNDPNTINFDGTPVTGRVPPKLRVDGGGELTQQQAGEVMHAYKLFRDAVKLTVAGYLVQNRTLLDGTRVRMESLQDQDTVYVWPVGKKPGNKLPHGFAVATNWRAPKIFRRRLIWPPGEPQWKFASDQVPQVKSGELNIFDNQVFRKLVKYITLPLILRKTIKRFWDYMPHDAPDISGTQVVPVRLEYEGQFTLGSPHYLTKNTVVDAKGVILYSMADQPPILVPEHPDYPESVHYWPGNSDAKGVQACLQAMRFTVISPTFNIWKFKFWNERINRTGDSTYALVERAATEFTTPWGHQTTTTTSINDNSLGEDPALLFKFKATGQAVPGAYYGGGSGRRFFVGWAGANTWIDITNVPVAGDTGNALRQITEQAVGLVTHEKLIATATAADTGYIPIERRLNYPASIFWRGGDHSKWYYPENLVQLFGWAPGSSIPLNYRIHSVAIVRYDTKYDVDGSPTITAKLGWKDLHLLEGTTTGRMSGKEYTNQLGQIGSYYYIDGGWGWTWITKEIRTAVEFFDPVTQYQAYWDWMDAANVKDEYWADYMAYGTHPGYTQTTAPQPMIKYEYPFNIRPSNTVSYDLKSRYVIDFDQKGRFYAAIRCEVTATGAAWKENLAVYKGFMIKDTDPSYTVKIWFECEWDGVFAQQLLAEESVTRPMFEAITVSQFNPWYWPFPAYIDRDCKVRTPPEPKPDENFMMMFKNFASHQGVNTNLCCADVRPDITGADVALTQSTEGIEYSYMNGERVVPHTRYVTGQLYARTFKLSDIYKSLWMLCQLKFDAVEDNFQPIDGPTKPTWFYHPTIKAALEVNRHIEVRDGIIVQWSDNLPGETTGYPPTPAAPPVATARDIKLYRV